MEWRRTLRFSLIYFAEIKALIERNYARALELLTTNRDLMDELAEELKAREEISGRELRERVAAPVDAAVTVGAVPCTLRPEEAA